MMRKIVRYVPAILAALAAGVILPSSSVASTNSAQMAVTATVSTNCAVATTPLIFGNLVAPMSGTKDYKSTATITLTCTAGAAASIAIDSGLYVPAGGPRQMQIPNSLNPTPLMYDLNSDGNGTNWVVGLPGLAEPTAGGVSPYAVTVYGVAHVSSGTLPGSYSDTVTVTVTA